MASNRTFADELIILLQVQGALYREENAIRPDLGRSGFAPLDRFPNAADAREGLLGAEFAGQPSSDLQGIRTPVSISAMSSLREGAIEELLADELGIDVGQMLIEARTNASGGINVAAAVAEFGTDAFATYLPWHMYARSFETPWGMYFFLEPLVEWAVELQRRASSFGLELNDSQALRLAFYVSYRHELFHFHVESFCIRQEVLTATPIYLPYDRDVFRKTAGTDDWLEEALAQAVVLESRLVSSKLALPKAAYRSFLEGEFDRFGPGYRAFRCESLGGPKRGHEVLAVQIMSASISPTVHVTKSYTPKCEYGIAPKNVPAYITWNPSYTSQFQFATPKKKKVYAYLKAKGFEFIGPGPGDHERWRHGRHTIHVNFRKNECDPATIKEIARVLGKNVREVIDEMNDRPRKAMPTTTQ